jgi:hypothetical protein
MEQAWKKLKQSLEQELKSMCCDTSIDVLSRESGIQFAINEMERLERERDNQKC